MKQSTKHAALFFSVILLLLFVKLFILDIRRVSGPSMEPGLPDGSVIVEFKLAWGVPLPFGNRYLVRWGEPVAGDLVIYPWNDRYVVKRCVETAGNPLAFSEDSGYSIRIGDRRVSLTGPQYQRLKNVDRVPEGMILALGDNMAESRDSRDYGFVSLDSIRGQVIGAIPCR